MDKKTSNLDSLRGKNPFKTPQGYMDGLADRIMEQLPEKPLQEETIHVSLLDQVRPWLYMAAVFVGLGLFFKTIVGIIPQEYRMGDSLLVQTQRPDLSLEESSVSSEEEQDELDYLEYIEAQYSSAILAEELNEDE